MPTTPKISVVMSTYNHAGYIQAAVKSVLGQTYGNLEVIVVNDGSTDGTEAVLKTIKDDRFRYITQANRGPSVALNTGLRAATGEYVALMSGDDVCAPERLLRQLETSKKTATPIIFSHVDFIGEEGEKIAPPASMAGLFNCGKLSRGEILRRFFNEGNFLNAVTFFAERSVLADEKTVFHPLLFALQDYDLWLRLVKRFEIGVIPEPLVHYRVRSEQGNLSSRSQKNQRRLATEYFLIHRDFFKGVSKELFESAFGKTTKEKLLVESRFPYSKLAGIELAFDKETVKELDFTRALQANEIFSSEAAHGSTLFVDTGNGFNAEQSIVSLPLEEGPFSLTFDLSTFPEVKQLRWDPVENSFCRVKITSHPPDSLLSNGIRRQDGFDFFVRDPMLIFTPKPGVSSFTISGEWQTLSLSDLDDEMKVVSRRPRLRSTLYAEHAGMFSEAHSQAKDFDLSDAAVDFEFDLTRWKQSKKLRWDPLEGHFCHVRLISAAVDGRTIKAGNLETNGVTSDDGFDFITGDPMIFFTVPARSSRLTIKAKLTLLSIAEIEAAYQLKATKRITSASLLKKATRLLGSPFSA